MPHTTFSENTTSTKTHTRTSPGCYRIPCFRVYDACVVSRRNLFIYTRWVCLLLKVVFPERDQHRAFIFVSVITEIGRAHV